MTYKYQKNILSKRSKTTVSNFENAATMLELNAVGGTSTKAASCGDMLLSSLLTLEVPRLSRRQAHCWRCHGRRTSRGLLRKPSLPRPAQTGEFGAVFSFGRMGDAGLPDGRVMRSEVVCRRFSSAHHSQGLGRLPEMAV